MCTKTAQSSRALGDASGGSLGAITMAWRKEPLQQLVDLGEQRLSVTALEGLDVDDEHAVLRR